MQRLKGIDYREPEEEEPEKENIMWEPMTAEEEEKAKAEKKEREEKKAAHEKQKIERIMKNYKERFSEAINKFRLAN